MMISTSEKTFAWCSLEEHSSAVTFVFWIIFSALERRWASVFCASKIIKNVRLTVTWQHETWTRKKDYFFWKSIEYCTQFCEISLYYLFLCWKTTESCYQLLETPMECPRNIRWHLEVPRQLNHAFRGFCQFWHQKSPKSCSLRLRSGLWQRKSLYRNPRTSD